MSKQPQLPRGLTQGHSPHIWRWIPTPALRRDGWKAVTFKHPSGQHMDFADAIRAAQSINALIADLEAGLPVGRNPYAHLAPKTVRPLMDAPQPRSIGNLIDAFLSSNEYKDLKTNTQRDYRGRLNRLIEVISGHVEGDPRRLDLPQQAKNEAIRRFDADTKAARAIDVADFLSPDEPLQTAYDLLAKQINPRTGQATTHNANAVMRVTQRWLQWVIDKKKLLPSNPASDVKRKPSPGRIVVWEDTEVAILLDQCHRSGWHSVAYAVELALELSWSQFDILNLTWGQIKNGRIKGTRSKTGNMTHTTLTDNGHNIIDRLRADYQAVHGDNVLPAPDTPLLIVDHIQGRNDHGAVGKPWNSSYFQHTFIDIKNACNFETNKTFQDLRDTAITRMLEMELTPSEIQSRSQHSLAQIQNIIDKHYGLSTLYMSDAAAAKLNKKRSVTT